jgi:hypothetical protein
MMQKNISARIAWSFAATLFATGMLISAGASTRDKARATKNSGQRLTAELNGSVVSHDGQHLHFSTDLGNIVIHSQNSSNVDYKVHLETDASQKDAKLLLSRFAVDAHATPDGVSLRGKSSGRQNSGRLWVTFEISVPKSYNLEVSTGGGNIETDDVNGRVSLATSGGNLVAGNIGGSARLETDGGHISVKAVKGELVAVTGGGHITTGAVGGNAALRSGGGHIRVASVGGIARLETTGGNVSLEHSGTELVAETGGGQIQVGEAAGIVRAKTGGGGIHVVRLSGPTNLETGDGSIYLTQVDSPVKASTSVGGITAWFVAPSKQSGMCEFQSGDGDIVVYIPRQLPVTIDAQIQRGDQHRVIVDPAFPLTVSYSGGSDGRRTVRAEGSINGGGEVIRLRTMAGNIHVVMSDANKQVQIYKQQMEQMQQKLQLQMRLLEQSMVGNDETP